MPKKVFIAYKHTGEDQNDLQEEISRISEALQQESYQPVCMFWRQKEIKENDYDLEKIYELCDEEIANCDHVLFYVKKDDQSYGMEWELQRCLETEKRFCLFIKRGVRYQKFRDQIKQVHEFDDLGEISQVFNFI